MIGLDITEEDYRNLEYPSYSLLSGISRNGKSAITEKFKPNYSTKFGILVESLLFEDYNEDDYYIIKELLPDGKLKDACDIIFPILVEKNIKYINLSDNLDTIEIILNNNYVDYWDKKDNNWRANKIINEKGVQDYWKSYLESIGKITISEKMLENAKYAVNILQMHMFTKNIFSKYSFFNIEKQSQVKLIFNYKGRVIKVMIDWLVIDHDKKIIIPYDLKTGGKLIEEFEDSFYYWRYDIQAFLYQLAVINLRDKYYKGYKIQNFRFVYISRNDLNRPIIYKVSNKSFLATLKGFYRKGVYYKSVIKLIEEYEWYVNNPDAMYSKEIYDSSGEVMIADNIEINAKN